MTMEDIHPHVSTQVKAWTYTSSGYPSTLKLSTTNVPRLPDPNHILVRIHACALNPVDIQFMNLFINNIPYYNTAPKIPGCDFSGVVVASSEETAGEYKIGDEVMGITFGNGCLTEIAQINPSTAAIVKKPSHWSWVEAASLPLVWLTARTSIEKCIPFVPSKTKEQMRVVVLGGSSSTGIYTIKIARRRNWRILSSCSARNADSVMSLGADEVVDYTSSQTAVVDAVKKFAPHAIVDCVGGTECVGLAPMYVTIVGDKTSRSAIGGPVIYWTHPRMVLRWAAGRVGLSNRYDCVVINLRKDWLEECLTLKGKQQAQNDQESEIVVDSVFDFGRGKEAFERMDTGRARGKVVVEIKNEGGASPVGMR